ncbi:glycine--tRNA ligase subunit beta [Sandaracinobacter sp. RS1-74]|uniref:glycine--tRNA ligase subunit beta n=1 Tax=Sandaracinobacteroides sayramensis TaxID=2913411 RepID=UPI001ED9DCB0|nr:glycine--tRNA ligase subunit beta [Sandaracinobacteroides sayramensis]MCG2840286.1 glycine--tRNA ligase subunit beta [Sandaracinobacteroides sayramensis]
MADFLLELFSEEIPARMQPAAAQQLREKFEALLADSGLSADALETHATPRRLALIARGLPAASQAVSEERRGPRADAPAAAIEGFLKSTGLTRAQLEERETGKGVFLFANLAREGRPAAELLAAKLPALIGGFQWPKSQRWGRASVSTSSPRWVRPLRGIVALFDKDVVPFEALGLQSGRETFGHRFMGGGKPLSIDSPDSYAGQLHTAHVVLSAGERRALIRAGAEAAAANAGLQLRVDEALEAENAGLTEWPVPLLGRFDPAFLEVPPEIIQLTMATNQKYFAVEDADGKLAPGFVCVSNLVAPDGGRTIVAGNERVLSARLSDARFFWTNDKAKPLESFTEKLKDIVFHEQLGTMAEKVERVAKLARWLATEYFPNVDPDMVERAARLAKADLTTGTVGEFPELQGVIGGYLAEAQGEKPGIVSALKQHYSACPEGCVPVAVALADRLDTLVSFFGAGIRPTGSKDPFALRRAALGVLDMLVSGGRRIALKPALEAAGAKDADDLIAFFADRLKVQQREAGVRHDLIDAVLALGGEDDLVRLLVRVKALQAFVETEDGRNLLAGYRRAANILKAEEKKDGKSHRLDLAALQSPYLDEAEKNLARLFAPSEGAGGMQLFDEADALFGREDFEGAMKLLATLREPVDRFFDDVTVNDADPAVRARRLGLLAGVRDGMHKVADFSRIEG